MLHTNIRGVIRTAAVPEIHRFCSLNLVNVITLVETRPGGQNAFVSRRKFSVSVGTHVDCPRTLKKGGGLST